MDKATISMIENLRKNTGKSLEQWIDIVLNNQFTTHGEAMKFLKETHGLTHGFANLVVLNARQTDSGSSTNPESLITKQYQGKEHFKPIYDKIITEIKAFGNDIEIAPKNAYVSLRRKKQFATLTPATKTRFEVGINLRGQEPQGILNAAKPNSMCSHIISLSGINDVDDKVISWIQLAYNNAR